MGQMTMIGAVDVLKASNELGPTAQMKLQRTWAGMIVHGRISD